MTCTGLTYMGGKMKPKKIVKRFVKAVAHLLLPGTGPFATQAAIEKRTKITKVSDR